MKLRFKRITAVLFSTFTLAIVICATPSVSYAQSELSERLKQEEKGSKNRAKLVRQAKITMDQARAFALARVSGKIENEELEKEDGRLIYSFDIRNEKGTITGVEIDAKTGEVINVEEEDDQDSDDDDDDQEEATIIFDRAREIALARAHGKVEIVELEKEDGRLIYSFDIRNEKGTITEVKVDAKTGEVISVEEEDVQKDIAEKQKEEKEKSSKKRKP